MKRETKWKRVEDNNLLKPFIKEDIKDIDFALVRIYQYVSLTEFSQILQFTYKLRGGDKFLFAKHRIKHDYEEEEIKNRFPGIETYTQRI